MPKEKGKRKRQSSRHNNSYQLSEIRQKIDAGEVVIRGNAYRCARSDFGWEHDDILRVYRRLKPSHCTKTKSYQGRPTVAVDYYKADLYGENIYTHFYIDDTERKLVISSFKRI